MSVMDEAIKLRKNIDKVYEAGAASTQGTDAFWDVYQNYGNRKDYSYAFYGSVGNNDGGWTDENFKPKYPICPTAAQCMFEKSEITSISENDIDFSKTTSFAQTFRNAKKMKNITMNVTSATGMAQTFQGVTTLETLTLIGLPANCTFNNTFRACSSLTNLQIDGTIGRNGFDVSTCTNLTTDAIWNGIFVPLEDKSSDTSGTSWVCTLGATNLAKMSDSEKAYPIGKGWTLA